MTLKHPYIAATGAVGQILTQLRKSFPAVVDASTLKKLSIAPNNESYLINILKFLGLLEDDGKRSEAGRTIFVKHDDAEFAAALAEKIESAYAGLFELHGPDGWNLPMDGLISFFRQTDETSDVIGMRQARTFSVLAQFVKRREGAVAIKKAAAPAKAAPASKAAKSPAPKPQAPESPKAMHGQSALTALTVRIEVNLPAGGDQETYDAIFKSIRANLM